MGRALQTARPRNERFGKCRLCSKEQELKESHLLPRSISVLLRRNSTSKNPNPLFISDTVTAQTQSQFKDYLLCSGCEQRFSDRGESWVVGNCYRGENNFPLREQILRLPAILESQSPHIIVYSASQAPAIECDKLLYFALSVFWRAAVYDWSIRDCRQGVRTFLGPYELRVQDFLLDRAPLPESMALNIRIGSPDRHTGGVMLPLHYNQDGFHTQVHDSRDHVHIARRCQSSGRSREMLLYDAPGTFHHDRAGIG
jgi:hypothetical protein